ncbi:MAG TPA: phosphoadenosine phosphosulfate reductase family protein, partial [Solirubrobacterales bacterium]|nr:phosphoadenosine phosphosulfate reductase family protein [Solirubrobacterales bacterium]
MRGVAAPPAPPRINGDPIDPREVNERLESLDADEVIAWAVENFHPSLYFACSFQRTTSVIVDIAQRVEPSTRFFYLDTGLLFEQTYMTRDALAARYGIGFDRFHNISVDQQARLYGDKLWERQPDACCGIRKVEPMRDALA